MIVSLEPFAAKTSCGVRKKNVRRHKRIVGGTQVVIHDWPWMVNIYTTRKKDQICGGVVIASNWILTSAHCFLGEHRKSYVDEFLYYVGDHTIGKIDQGERRIFPENSYFHPDYISPAMDYPGNNDICLIKLKYSLEWNNAVKPVGELR